MKTDIPATKKLNLNESFGFKNLIFGEEFPVQLKEHVIHIFNAKESEDYLSNRVED